MLSIAAMVFVSQFHRNPHRPASDSQSLNWRLGAIITMVLMAASPPSAALAQVRTFDDVLGSYACVRSTAYCQIDFLKRHDDGLPNLCVEAVRICRAAGQRNALAFMIAWRRWSITRGFRDYKVAHDNDRSREGLSVSSAGRLLKACRDSGEKEQEACRSYSSAWGGVMIEQGRHWMAGEKERTYPPVRACSSKEISVDEYVQAFVEWAEKHPDRMDDDVGKAVSAATEARWPCPNPG